MVRRRLGEDIAESALLAEWGSEGPFALQIHAKELREPQYPASVDPDARSSRELLSAALMVGHWIIVTIVPLPGFEAITRTVTLVEGKAETLAIPDLTAVPVSATEPSKPVAGRGAEPEPVLEISPTRKYVAMGSGVSGVAAIGAGLLVGHKASSTYHDAKALCGANLVCGTDDYAHGQQLIRDTRFSAAVSTVLVATGGAAIVTGVVVFFTGRRAREPATAQVVPVTYDRAPGLAVMGRW